MPRGRVRVLDDAKQREICALISAGCSLQAAASYVECAPNTIRREVARNPEFGRRFRDARLQAQLSPLQAMRKASATHWRAAAWMLERSDPDHFARRPPPAFRPKQARALRHDILAILSAEIENPFLLTRVKKQIRQLIDYSIDGLVSVERTNRSLRSDLRLIDELQRQDEQAAETAFSAAEMPALRSAAQSANSGSETADRGNGRPATAPFADKNEPSADGQPTADPANVPPTRLPPILAQPSLDPSALDPSPPSDPNALPA